MPIKTGQSKEIKTRNEDGNLLDVKAAVQEKGATLQNPCDKTECESLGKKKRATPTKARNQVGKRKSDSPTTTNREEEG